MNKLTEEIIGTYAKMLQGFGSGLIGKIERNETGIGVSPYVHVTKSGLRTGVMFAEQIEIIETDVGE